MFSDDDKKVLANLLERVLPPQVEQMLSARAKLAAGATDFTAPEGAALTMLLDRIQYTGNEAQIRALLEQTATLRAKLMTIEKPPAKPKHPAKAKPAAPAEKA